MSKTYRSEPHANSPNDGMQERAALRLMPNSSSAGSGNQAYPGFNEVPALAFKRRFEPCLRRTAAAFLTLLCCGFFAPFIEAQTQLTGSQVRIFSNPQTGTSYTVSQSDCGQLLSFSNASPVAVSLPHAGSSGLSAGCWLDIENTGAGVLTLTPNQSTIDGAATLQLVANQGLRLIFTGVKYLTERGSAGGNGIGNCVLSGSNADQLACLSVSSNNPSLPGQIALYGLAANGNAYFGWSAPPLILSSYVAQVPQSPPSGQVMQFGPPDATTSISTGQWITLGPIATQSSVLPSQLPPPTTSTLGAVKATDCSSVGVVQKINTDGTITCASVAGASGSGSGSGSTVASGATLTTAIWAPFGLTSGTATFTVPLNGSIVVAKVKIDSPTTISRLSYEFVGSAHAATAIYSDIGNLLASQSTGTGMCGGCVVGLPLSAPYTAAQGVYYMAVSSDSTGGDSMGIIPGASFLNPDIGSFSSFGVATAANTVSWSGGLATWPATLGALLKNNNCPMFVIGY